MSTPVWLTVSQCAARLKISERTVRRRCESGKLAARLETTATGKAWLIEAAAIGQAAANGADAADAVMSDGLAQEYSASEAAAARPADGADMVRTMGRLEGYAARDLERTIAQAVKDATAPLLEMLREQRDEMSTLRAQLDRLEASVSTPAVPEKEPIEAAQGAQSTPVKESTSATKQSPQRGVQRRKLTAFQRAVRRVIGAR